MMRFRRKTRAQQWSERVGELSGWQRAAALAVPGAAVAGVAYKARRRLWQGLGLVASAVEQVADTVEDAAEAVRDAARRRAAAEGT